MANALEAHLASGSLTNERQALARATVIPPPSEQRAENVGGDEPLAIAERRVISAVFANFSRSKTALGPEELETILAGMADFEAIASGLGGDCSVMIGNRAVAVFGFRDTTADDLVRAARTAMQVRHRYATVDMAVVTVRVIAESHAIPRDALERAVSMLGEEIDGIVVDEITASMLESHFEIQPRLGRRVLVGERFAEFDRSPPLLGQNTPTVGREREIRLLDGMLQDCVNDLQAQAVLITGEPGIGKSRLRRAWIENLLTQTPPMWVPAQNRSVEWSEMVLLATPDPMGTGGSLNVLGQLIRHAAGIKASDAPKYQQHKLYKRLLTVFEEAEVKDFGAFIAEMAGIPWSEPNSTLMLAARMNPSLMGDRVRLAWLDWIAAECHQHPLLLVIEDLQWADEASVLLLDATLKHCAKQSLMVLAFARPEVHKQFPKLWAARGTLLLALGDLSIKAATALVRGCLSTEISDDVVDMIVNRAGGNAFFLEELIRAEHHRRTSASKDEPFSFPESLIAQVQARLQSLSALERRVLRIASVFGEQFWLSPVVELLDDCNPVEIRRAVSALESQELLRRSTEGRFADEQQYVFRQRMIRDAAYDMLSTEDRGATHQWVAQWLLSVGERDVSRIADHFVKGNDTQLAAPYLIEAAEIALEASDLPGAIALSAKALACGVPHESLGAVYLLRAEALRWRGENKAALAAALEARDALPIYGELWFRAAREITHTAGRLLENDTLVSMSEQLGAPSERFLSQAEVAACARAAECLTHSGFPQLASKLLAKVTATDGSVDTEDPWIQGSIDALRAGRALTAGALGTAAEIYQQTISLYEALGDTRTAAICRFNLGFTLGQLGAYAEAEASFKAAILQAEKLGLLDVISGLQYNLTFVLGRMKRLEEALAFGRRALADFSAQGNRLLASMAKVYMADALYWSGDFETAAVLASEAVAEGIDGPFLTAGLTVASGAALALGDKTKAIELGTRGINMLEAIGGTNTMEMFLRLVHVEALLANDKIIQAEDSLRVAMERFAFRLDSIKDPEVRERFKSAPPEHRRLVALAEHYLRDTLDTVDGSAS